MMDDFLSVSAQQQRLSKLNEISSSASTNSAPTLPTADAIKNAESSLLSSSSTAYLQAHATEDTVSHITEAIIPALNGQAQSSRYYGFVTGGVLPIAEWADNIVTHFDQNVQVHLPNQSIATSVESVTLKMLADLLRLNDGGGASTADAFPGKTFTTGATASNVLGLACGREAVLAKRLGTVAEGSVGELGLLEACLRAGVKEIQILTSGGHSSLSKAASIVGLGRCSVKELGLDADESWRLDLLAVERELKRPNVASIIAVSVGEVNTGGLALNGIEEWKSLRALADQYGAWIHADGAFGIFHRTLDDSEEFKSLRRRTEGVELADSITIDGHKVLNVPYDCGMFFTRSESILKDVFLNPNAAYLASSSTSTTPSPLNIGLENSRRFRALPVYAVLHNEGREGIARMVGNMVRLARQVAGFISSSDHFELLPNAGSRSFDGTDGVPMEDTSIIVLFRAKDPVVNETLPERINKTRQVYVSGTRWKGEKAVRIAVSTWRVDVERDFEVIKDILSAVGEGR